MHDFIINIFELQFLQNAIIAGLLSSVACGITGTFVVVKRISYIGGGIAHAVMGGIGAAYFWNINPMYGAIVFAVFSGLLIGLVILKLQENEDTVISALWSIGMATGIILAYLTPGYNVDLITFLFGNILLVDSGSILILLIIDIVIIVFTFLFFRQIIYTSFDREYAFVRGIKVDLIYYMMLVMIALTVVILVQTVGLILVISLLTLPSAIARIFSNSISRMIFISIVLVALFIIAGIYISFSFNIPAGATIILVAGLAYFLTLFFSYFKIITK
ncbi:MAG: metal ABC transporter permease [Ignavibacteria bacterium]|jgi:zinc transport system permease protein